METTSAASVETCNDECDFSYMENQRTIVDIQIVKKIVLSEILSFTINFNYIKLLQLNFEKLNNVSYVINCLI